MMCIPERLDGRLGEVSDPSAEEVFASHSNRSPTNYANYQ